MADDQPYQMESATSIVVIVLIILVIIGIIILMVAWFNSSNAPSTTTTQNKEISEDDDDDDAGASIGPAPRLGPSRTAGATGCGPCAAASQKNALHPGIHVTSSQPNMEHIPILMVNDDDEDEASGDHRPHAVDIKTPSDGSVINLMLSDRSEVHIHVSDKSGPVRRLLSDMPSDQSEEFSIDNLPSVEFGSVETTSVDRYPKSSPRSGRSPPALVSPASPSSRLSAGPTGVLNQMVEQSNVMPTNLPLIPVVGASRIDGSLSDPANFSSDFSSQNDMSARPVQQSKIRIPAPPPKVPANLKMGPLSSGDI
jgi:hypothetical protein